MNRCITSRRSTVVAAHPAHSFHAITNYTSPGPVWTCSSRGQTGPLLIGPIWICRDLRTHWHIKTPTEPCVQQKQLLVRACVFETMGQAGPVELRELETWEKEA